MATTSKDPKKVEIERLRSMHPDLRDKEPEYRFYLKSYEGGQSYVGNDTLFTHARENRQDYDERLKRAHYQNYCQPLTDFVVDFIYASDIERDAGLMKPQFDNFIKNVNRSGLNLNEFMREVAEEARMFGHMFVQVDKPELPMGLAGRGKVTVSLKEASKLDLNPYFIKVSPLEVLDWVTDANGSYTYLKRVEVLDELLGRQRRAIERYSEWYLDEVIVSKVDVSEDEPKYLGQTVIQNMNGKIPFIKVPYKRSKSNRDMSISFLADIAGMNRSVFNKTSLIDEFLYRQAFNVLTMPRNTQVATKDSVDGVIGTSNILEYPNDARNPPQYLSPAADPAAFIQSERAQIIEEMYRTAAQDMASEIMAGSNRSGEAARESMGRQIPMIARQADTMQQAEQLMFSLWAEMQGKKWDGKIAYKDDYSVTSMMDLILQFTSLFNSAQVLSPTFVREEWKRLVRAYDGKLTPEVIEKIVAEINAVSDDEIKELITKPAPDQQAKPGVPSTANLTQGKKQRGSTDQRRSLGSGDRSHTKEGKRDGNRATA